MDEQQQTESTADFVEHKIERILVDNLLLDPENPRLASSTSEENLSQTELIKILWTEMAVDELVLSIAANGYFQEEPLFVVPAREPELEGKYYVLEGNRRLVAVQILLDDETRAKLRITDMPVITEEQKAKLKKLPVSIYESRWELWAFLSFRHINSPQEWDAYSKAKFVAHVHDQYGINLEEISRRIGDQHETVKRLYRGYKVLKQAEETGVYDVSERYRNRFYFSHWYTALAYPQFQEFLGMGPNDFEKEHPVPEKHLNELGELLTWIYGRKSGGFEIEPKVQKQNPHLNYLRRVISSPIALDALRSGYSLERSHEVSIGDERRFRESLTRAKDEIQRAKATVTTGYKGEQLLLKLVEEVQQIARTLRQEMEQIRDNIDST